MNMLIVGDVYLFIGNCRCTSHMFGADCELEVCAPAFDEDCPTTGPPGGQKQAPKPRVGNHS